MPRSPSLPPEFIGVFYPESTDLNNVLFAFETLGISYGVIYHNDPADLGDNKSHFHYVAKYDPTIAKKPTYGEFLRRSGLPSTQIRVPVRQIWRSVKYLTHESEDAIKQGKLQYDRDLIITNDPEWIENCYSCENDSDSEYRELEDDIALLASHTITAKIFLHNHPEFYYKASSLKAILELYNEYS